MGIFMNAHSKGLLKVISILFIIYGAIKILILALGLIGSADQISFYGGLPGIVIVILILIIAASVFDLIIGIAGLKRYKNTTKGKFYINTGIFLCTLSLASFVLIIAGIGFDFVFLGIPMAALTLIDLVLSVFFIIGGSINKKTTPPVA